MTITHEKLYEFTIGGLSVRVWIHVDPNHSSGHDLNIKSTIQRAADHAFENFNSDTYSIARTIIDIHGVNAVQVKRNGEMADVLYKDWP